MIRPKSYTNFKTIVFKLMRNEEIKLKYIVYCTIDGLIIIVNDDLFGLMEKVR